MCIRCRAGTLPLSPAGIRIADHFHERRSFLQFLQFAKVHDKLNGAFLRAGGASWVGSPHRHRFDADGLGAPRGRFPFRAGTVSFSVVAWSRFRAPCARSSQPSSGCDIHTPHCAQVARGHGAFARRRVTRPMYYCLAEMKLVHHHILAQSMSPNALRRQPPNVLTYPRFGEGCMRGASS